MDYLDPRTKECELEIQRIVHLQNIANHLPDALCDSKRVTKSHIPAENVLVKIDVPQRQITSAKNDSDIRLKRGRPLGSRYKNPQKNRGLNNENEGVQIIQSDKISPSGELPSEDNNHQNDEISINFVTNRNVWN